MEFQPSQKTEKEKSALEILRAKIWKAVTIGSLTLVLQACSPTREEIDAMPTVPIEDIIKNGDALMEKQVIKVEGWVEDLGKGGEEKERKLFAKQKITTHRYILRPSPDNKSPSVDMIATYKEKEAENLGESVVSMIPINFPKFNPDHPYAIIGQVVARKDNGQIKHVLEISRHGGVVDLAIEKSEKEK